MGCFPTVSPALMHSLEAISNDEEIQAALLDMAPLKAPGDGQSASLWDDIWIPALGPLHDHVIDPQMHFLLPRFNDLMLPSWDLPLLADIFPASVIPHFFNIRCPQPGDVADTCCWRWDQQFSVGSAYAKLMANRWNIPHPFWKKVWSLAVL
ncbi:hypothetical protein V6N12_070192 [Hibiscus sabdariffa]|uniref:Uncharacterized protein n=1 Tax=Hibiscus sabdariffa TaxID=183260 RepID=A0ABR2FG22_9ROSI